MKLSARQKKALDTAVNNLINCPPEFHGSTLWLQSHVDDYLGYNNIPYEVFKEAVEEARSAKRSTD